MQVKRYKKDCAYSYALGASVTIELLENRPRDCLRVISCPDYNDAAKAGLKSLCASNDIAFGENRRLINILSPKENCYVIGMFGKREYKLAKKEPHVVLDNPSDMGNIGTIMRSCAGFGVKNIALINGADAYNPKTVRASMGAFFHVNLEYFRSIQEYLAAYGEGRALYAFMTNAGYELTDIKPGKIYSLIFGNEASGLDCNIYKDTAERITISHANSIDSLNLPVAAGIALFWFTRDKNIDKNIF